MSSKSITVIPVTELPGCVRRAIGRTFGRLTVRFYAHSERKAPRGFWHYVDCDCRCGKRVTVRIDAILTGNTQSCGCLHDEGNNLIHGNARSGDWSPEFRAWVNMKTRCFNDRSKDYAKYGGAGVTVSPEWLGVNGFENFLAHVGKRPNHLHSLDRYPNQNGNYEPGNVRWASRKDQALNRNNTRFLTAFGLTLSVSDWAKQIGVNQSSLREWLKKYGDSDLERYCLLRKKRSAAAAA